MPEEWNIRMSTHRIMDRWFYGSSVRQFLVLKLEAAAPHNRMLDSDAELVNQLSFHHIIGLKFADLMNKNLIFEISLY